MNASPRPKRRRGPIELSRTQGPPKAPRRSPIQSRKIRHRTKYGWRRVKRATRREPIRPRLNSLSLTACTSEKCMTSLYLNMRSISANSPTIPVALQQCIDWPIHILISARNYRPSIPIGCSSTAALAANLWEVRRSDWPLEHSTRKIILTQRRFTKERTTMLNLLRSSLRPVITRRNALS